MLKRIARIYQFKVGSFRENDHRIVRLANLLAFLGVTLSSLYSLFYYVILNSTKAALCNEFFALCYLGYFYFLSKKKLFPALLSIIITYLCQMFFIVVFIASNQSGFHYYYFLGPPALYFFFKEKHTRFKISFSIVALILFFVCEMAGDKYSDWVLSDTHFKILYYSTIGIVFLLLLVITQVFQKEIDEREAKLEKENMERREAQQALEDEKIKIQNAFLEIKQLSGLLPICANCKKIRDDKGYWNQIETYIANHSKAEFSHGICPECKEKLYPDLFNPSTGERP